MSVSSSSAANERMTELPRPGAEALALSDSLRERLNAQILRSGPVSFARYMEQALYEPGLGYYMNGTSKLGAAGDFVTAPELSPLFGASLANEVAPILDACDGAILELGAGSGELACQILESLGSQREVQYSILEPSAELARRQRQRLEEALEPARFARVCWLERLPESFQGVILANEVMDALPVERFALQAGRVQQCLVDASLSSTWRTASEPLERAVRLIEQDIGQAFENGYSSEVCLLLAPWLNSLSQCLTRGVVLLIDYGYPRHEYYLSERRRGTLASHYRHRTHDDVYLWPGLQDITAHVDFTAVAESATRQELDLLGYSSQSAFLLDNRLLDLAEQTRSQCGREVERLALAQAIRTLTLPGEMGERFQVMALGRGYDLPLQGFRTRDLSHRL